MHIHKIDKQKHIDFLNQNRQDPITGDFIVEENEIVFCSVCKSAFLKESWEYLGKTHCNSSKTLTDFPIQKVLKLRILQDGNSLLFPIKGTQKETFEDFEDKLDDYFWKKIKVNIRIDAQTQRTIHSTNNFFEEANYVSYTLMEFVVFICIVLGIVGDFSEKG